MSSVIFEMLEAGVFETNGDKLPLETCKVNISLWNANSARSRMLIEGSEGLIPAATRQALEEKL